MGELFLTMIRFLFIAVALLKIPVCSGRKSKEIQHGEFLGCFEESEENRDFVSSAGDYDVNDLSPINCLLLCGQKYKYAALENGGYCFCGNSLSTSGKRSDAECNKKCNGSASWPPSVQWQKCGGPSKISVYNASERIIGLSMMSYRRLNILAPEKIFGNLVNGIDVRFSFSLGDGTITKWLPSREITHIFDIPGSYVITISATSETSGFVSHSAVYDVDDAIKDVKFDCPRAVEVGHIVECNGTILRGSRVNITAMFGNGQHEHFMLSSRYYYAGPRIPRNNDTISAALLNSKGTNVIPNYDFYHEGKITQWEFEGIKTGDVKLQIFSPVCSFGEKFCFSRRRCIAASEPCLQASQRLCAPTQVLCLFRRQCVDNTEQSKRACPSDSPYNTYSPQCDYKLRSESTINIPRLGYHIVNVAPEEQPVIAQGDLIGWTSLGGELGYQTLEGGVSFLFPTVPEIGQTLLRSVTPSKHHRSFMVAAHYAHETHFVTRKIYNFPGLYSVTTNVTGSTLVAVDYPITGVDFLYEMIVNTNTSLQFEVPHHAGTNTTYIWDFGNGLTMRTTFRTINFTYLLPGSFQVSLTAANSLSSVTVAKPIFCFDAITGFRFSKPIAARALGVATDVAWEVFAGTNLTYVVDFGDGTQRYTMVTQGPESQSGRTTHAYAAVGNYTVTIFAFNRVGPNSSVSTQAVVEVPIAGLEFSVPLPHVTSNVYLAVGDYFEVSRVFTSGTNILCKYEFMDGSAHQTTDKENIRHQYSATGTYRPVITCYNDVNSITKFLNGTIVVQKLEAIGGVTLTTNPTTFGDPSSIMLKISTGTTFFCDWDFGDGSSFKTDFSFLGNLTFHNYSSVGAYQVKTTCSNRLGSEIAQTEVQVDIPIDDVSLKAKKRYIRVHQLFASDVTVRVGSRMTYTWYYGDNTNYSIFRASVTPYETTKHAYARDGNFQLKAIVSNSLGSVTKSLNYLLVVQYPVENITLVSNSPIRLHPGKAIFKIDTLPGVSAPTNAYCEWNFADGIASAGAKKEPLIISNKVPHTTKHDYSKEGFFNVTINISNHVSSEVHVTRLHVKKVLQVYIAATHHPSGLPGDGSQHNFFLVSGDILFNCTSQRYDYKYKWDTGDGVTLNVTTDVPMIKHRYSRPGRFRVTVEVDNELAQLVSAYDIVIQNPIRDLLLSTSDQIYFGEPTQFHINMTYRGSDTCLTIDFNDGNLATFGNDNCNPMIVPPGINHLFTRISPTAKNFTVAHTFARMGLYNVTIVGHNEASRANSTLAIEIKDNPCDVPRVKILSDGTPEKPQTVKKSKPLLVKNEVWFKCLVGKKVVFTWTAFLVKMSNPNDESTPFPLTDAIKVFDMPVAAEDLENSFLMIKERTLPFSIVRLALKVGYIGRDRDVSDVFAVHNVWLEVQRSPMFAVIRGGDMRSVGYEQDILLDGSGSKDPDVGENRTGITYTWMCRKDKEEFPSDSGQQDPKAGCWGNGVFTINGTTNKINFYTGSLVQNELYVFRITVKKEHRQSFFDQSIMILPGNPPTMEMKCVFNCLKKLNPLERLVIESRCVDCKPNDVLGYEWSLYILSKGDNGNDLWTKMNNWARNTSTGINQGSLVINPNFLEQGKRYRTRLNAWKPGGYPGGFVQLGFTVNVPPASGTCDIHPLDGFAIVTNFSMKCSGWQDEDQPLRYLIELLKGEEVVPLYAGFEPQTKAVFPLGTKENNYTMDVMVKVMDDFFFTTSTKFKIRVVEPPSIDFGAVAGEMESGSDQQAMQITNAASSVLNAKSGGKEDPDAAAKRGAFRAQMAGTLSGIEPKDFDTTAQQGEALRGLTENPDEVDESAQNSTIKALSKSGAFLEGAGSERNLDNTAKSMVSAIGNTANAASTSTKKALNGTSSASNPNVTKDNTKNVLNIVDKISGALGKQQAVGDKAKKIKTPFLDLATGRKNLNDLAGEDDDDDDEGGFQLPNPKALFGGANASDSGDGAMDSIGSTMTAMDDNPFAWDDSSKDVNSKVVGLALTDGTGSPLDLSGQMLEMFVPRDTKKNPIKPLELNHFSADEPAMRVHKFNRTSNESGIAVEILTFEPELRFVVFLRYGKRPSANHYDKTHIFPSLTMAKKMKKKPHPFTYVVAHDTLNLHILNFTQAPGNETMATEAPPSNDTDEGITWFLGIKAINKDSLSSPNTSYGMRIYLPSCKMFLEDLNTWTTKGCWVGPKTRANNTHCMCIPGGDDEGDGDEEETPTAAAQSGGESNVGQPVQKRKRFKKKVSKVSFGGGFFPAPNPIDFSKVFNVSLADNPVAFATVMAILGVYIILAIWARREDLKDIQRAGVTPLEDNDECDKFHYEITVCTGYGKKAATTSEVFFIMAGEEGETEPRALKDPKRKCFQRRGTDMFLATFRDPLGELNYLHIWHTNTGRSPSWYLSRVVVHDLNNDKKYLFICEGWLAVEEGDGTVDRRIPVAGHDEMTSFNHLFYSTTQKNLADGHLWFSIFIRPPKSRFTRLQRLSCCLTLLLCSMLASAMFYNVGGSTDPSNTIQLGPLQLSPAQIGIGIMSSLVVVPANLFIVGVFRGVEPKPSKEDLKERRSRKCWWFMELFFCFFDLNKKKNNFIEILHNNPEKPEEFLDFSHSTSRTNLTAAQETEEFADVDLGLGQDNIDFRISKQERKEEMEKKQKKKKKKKKALPYWFLYIGWTVCFLTTFVCTFFVVLYGFQFGKDKSAQWISSMLISFFQDVLVSQPLKVLGLALVVAVIIKKPQEEEEDGDKKKMEDEDWVHESVGDGGEDSRSKKKVQSNASMIRFEPPDKEKLKRDRELRFKEMQMNEIIKEVALYLFFLTCLCIVTYSHRDPSSYSFRISIENSFVNAVNGGKRNFMSIGSRENFYEYAKTTLMSALYPTTWYNDEPVEFGYLGDKLAYSVGGARIRQLRINNNTCKVPYDFLPYIFQCNSWYSFFDEDEGQYDIAWEPLKNESLYFPPFTYEAWEHISAFNLDAMPFMAYVATYNGGGFVADLGNTSEYGLKVLETLESNRWIDEKTRGVIVEVAAYNAIVNLFCIVTLAMEILPTNGVFTYTDFKISRLFTFGGGFQQFLLVCELFIIFFFAVFIYRELKALYRQRRGYFKEFWNCVEFFIVLLVLTSVAMFMTRIGLVNSALAKLRSSPGKFVSFSRVASWNELFVYIVAMVVFMSWLKAIKLLRFNSRMSMLAQTLKGAAGPLASFSLVFVVFFMAYSTFAFAVFGPDLAAFYNFVSTLETVMGILLGSFDYLEIESAQPILGRLFFFSFMVFGTFILMNMFLTIVMDVFAEVKDSAMEQANEHEIVDFMIGRFKKWSGVGAKKVSNEADKKELKEVDPKELRAFKKRNKRKRKKETMDMVSQRFDRLETSLNGFYCDEWAEERMLDAFVERKWGVNPDQAYAEATAELEEDEHREGLRQDMYAALDMYDAGASDIKFSLSFEEEDPKKDLFLTLH